jgi:hypothetical protein
MPTFETLPRFETGWRSLTREQQATFRKTVIDVFTQDLMSPDGEFGPELQVRPVPGHPEVFEMSWGENGRAAFSYNAGSGETHVIWRQIAVITTGPPAERL